MKKGSWPAVSGLAVLLVSLTIGIASVAGIPISTLLGSAYSGAASLLEEEPAGMTRMLQANISLVDEGKQLLVDHKLLEARDKFKLAVEQYPENQEAQLYYGVTRVVALYEEGQNLNTTALDSVKEILTLSGFTFTSYGVYGTEGEGPRNGPAPTTPATGKIIDFLAAKAIPEIDAAIENLEKVTSSSFTSTLQSAGLDELPGDYEKTIDFADVLIIKSLLYGAKANLELLRVYSLNANLPSVINVETSPMKNIKNILMGNAAFLTPVNPSRLPHAKEAMVGFIDTYTEAVQAVKARTVTSGHLFVFDQPLPEDQHSLDLDYELTASRLAEIKASLSGPTRLSFADQADPAGVIDLSRFFNASAPVNIRTKIADCAAGKVFPDPTFGGVLPLGIGDHEYSLLSYRPDILGVMCSNYATPSSLVSPDWLDLYYYRDPGGNISTYPAEIYLENEGTGNLVFTSSKIVGADKGLFVLRKGSCSSTLPTLPPGGSCSLSVEFNPTSSATAGTKQAALELVSNDPNDSIEYVFLGGYYDNPGLEYEFPAPPKQTLNVAVSGSGSVSYPTFDENVGYVIANCSSLTTPCSATYGNGFDITLAATPDVGWIFAGWTGCSHYDGLDCTVDMFTSKNITAKFTLDATKPTGGIAINGGAKATGSSDVTITLAPKDTYGSGVASYCLGSTAITTCGTWTPYDANAPTAPWSLSAPATDGTKTVYALFKDIAGNVSLPVSDTILLDTKAPTGTVKINGGAAETAKSIVTLALTAADGTGSGVASVSHSTDNGATWSAPAPFAASKEITLPAGDGSSTVQVKFIDHAGNVSLPASDTINLDTTKPAGTLQINGGADYTNKTAVTLGMTAADGATGSGISQARYSLNGTTWSAWEAYKPTRAFTLPAGAGSKTVYAQLKDKAGNASEPVMDSITLDISRPSDGSCTATPNGDNTLLLAWGAATDAGGVTSGIKEYRLYHGTAGIPACSGTPLATVAGGQALTYTSTGLSAARIHYYRVCAADNAGNLSPGATASRKPTDTTKPTAPQVTINSGADYTKNTAVTLGLGATDAGGIASVCISNTTDCTTWQAFAPTKAWTLPSGQGTKTVYVKYKDTAGNISDEQASDTIIFDNIAPAGQIIINNGDPLTKSASVTLKLSVADANPGISMQFSNNGTTWSQWEAFASEKAWTLAGADGAKTVYARFRDAAGNVSTAVKDTITLDTKAPALAVTAPAPTTIYSSKLITGTKEANSTVSITLNGTPIDAAITQTLAGTAWSATVGPFSEGENTIEATATDAAGNSASKSVTISLLPFRVGDLEGAWNFVAGGINWQDGEAHSGKLVFDAAGNVLSGNVWNTGATQDSATGNFNFQQVAQYQGNITFGSPLMVAIIPSATMSSDRQLMAFTGSYRFGEYHVGVALREGSGYTSADLAGTWYIYGGAAGYLNGINVAGMLKGSIIVDATGKVIGGALVDLSNVSMPITGGKVTIDNSGKLAGTITVRITSGTTSVNLSVSIIGGAMAGAKNLLALTGSMDILTAGTLREALFCLKAGQGLATNDLAGTWDIHSLFTAQLGAVEPGGDALYGTVEIGQDGKITGGDGYYVGKGGAVTMTGGNLTLASTGSLSGSFTLSDSTLVNTIKAGRLSSTKSEMVLISSRSNGTFNFLVATKRQ